MEESEIRELVSLTVQNLFLYDPIADPYELPLEVIYHTLVGRPEGKDKGFLENIGSDKSIETHHWCKANREKTMDIIKGVLGLM